MTGSKEPGGADVNAEKILLKWRVEVTQFAQTLIFDTAFFLSTSYWGFARLTGLPEMRRHIERPPRI